MCALKNPNTPTAVITHGANPGLISHLLKQALLNLADENELNYQIPATRDAWALLANQLGIKVVHIAEHDSQIGNTPKKSNEFVNTWSVHGFISEASQPVELGWGTHERHWPHHTHHHPNSTNTVYMKYPGGGTRVRTWTPTAGPAQGYVITHAEALSMAHYLSIKKENKVTYSPTVHYAYVPCPDAILSLHEFSAREWEPQTQHRILQQDILSGSDELGILLMGNQKGAYWYGSQLSIEETRRLVDHNNATSLQVVAAVIAGILWAIDHPQRGVVEPEEMDFAEILRIAKPYLGTLQGYFTAWNPLLRREKLFPESLDREDPWQFINMLVR